MDEGCKRNCFFYKWRIENFNFCWHKTGEYLESPLFRIETLPETSWRLQLYPRGEQDGEYISCYLLRDEGGPEVVHVDFELSVSVGERLVKPPMSFEKIYCFKSFQREGESSFVLRREIFFHKPSWEERCTLAIGCRIFNLNGDRSKPTKKFGRTTIFMDRISGMEVFENVTDLKPENSKDIEVKTLLETDPLISINLTHLDDNFTIKILPKSCENIKYAFCKITIVKNWERETPIEHVRHWVGEIKTDIWRYDVIFPQNESDEQNIATDAEEKDIATKAEEKAIATKAEEKDIATNAQGENIETNSQGKDIATNSQEKYVATNAQEKQIATKAQEKQLATKAQEKHLATNDQKKQIATNAQEKQIETNDQEKDLVTNDQEKDLATNDQEKDIAKNAQEKDIAKNAQEKDIATNAQETLFMHYDFAYSTGVEYANDELNDYGSDLWIENISSLESTCEEIEIEDSTGHKTATDSLKLFHACKSYSDVTIVARNSFVAHKAVLRARSSEFTKMLQDNPTSIQIAPYRDEIVRRFLLFLYTDRMDDMQCEIAMELYQIADIYKVGLLKKKCRRFIELNCDVNNVSKLLSFGYLVKDCPLIAHLQKYIIAHDEEVFSSDEWQVFTERSWELAENCMLLKYQKNHPFLKFF